MFMSYAEMMRITSWIVKTVSDIMTGIGLIGLMMVIWHGAKVTAKAIEEWVARQ